MSSKHYSCNDGLDYNIEVFSDSTLENKKALLYIWNHILLTVNWRMPLRPLMPVFPRFLRQRNQPNLAILTCLILICQIRSLWWGGARGHAWWGVEASTCETPYLFHFFFKVKGVQKIFMNVGKLIHEALEE